MRQKIKNIFAYAYRRVQAMYLRLNKAKIANSSLRKNENGFLYIVTGDGYVKECLFSIQSLRMVNSERVCVFAPEKYRSMIEPKCDLFFPMDSKIKRPKVEFISQSPFEKTVYLDSDTYVDQNISDLFVLLDKYDFAGAFCNSRARENYGKVIRKYGEIPYPFSEINTGVMAFKSSPAVRALFDSWKKYYYEFLPKTSGWDQPSFRVALWESDAKICHLPPEYNVRPKAVYEKVKGNKDSLGHLHMEPRIFHGHYSADVHRGFFELSSITELRQVLRDLTTDIIY